MPELQTTSSRQAPLQINNDANGRLTSSLFRTGWASVRSGGLSLPSCEPARDVGGPAHHSHAGPWEGASGWLHHRVGRRSKAHADARADAHAVYEREGFASARRAIACSREVWRAPMRQLCGGGLLWAWGRPPGLGRMLAP